MRLRVLRAFVAGCLCAVAACAERGGEPTRVRLAVGGQPQLIYLPITLADRLGYYAEEGLDVQIQDFPGGARALQSLLGGSADVVCGYYDHTVQMAAEGRELTAFVAMLRYPGLVLVVSPTPRQRVGAVADLRGAIVGVTAPGSATHFFLNYLLVKSGLKPESVSVTGIGTSASAVAAVERSHVDAAIVVEPTFTQLRSRVSGLRVLADTRTAEGVRATFGVDEYPAAVLYAPQQWLSANEDTARRLARAIVRTLEWIRAHPDEIPSKVPEFVGADRDVYMQAVAHMLPTYSVDGRINAAGTTVVRDVLALSLDTVRRANVDVGRTFTDAYLPRAGIPAR